MSNPGPARFCVITPGVVVNASLITSIADSGGGDVDVRFAGGEKITVQDTKLEALVANLNKQLDNQH